MSVQRGIVREIVCEGRHAFACDVYRAEVWQMSARKYAWRVWCVLSVHLGHEEGLEVGKRRALARARERVVHYANGGGVR